MACRGDDRAVLRDAITADSVPLRKLTFAGDAETLWPAAMFRTITST